MKNSDLERRILMEMETLIAKSCPKQKVSQNYSDLHVALVKKHYNAAEVSFDYHRKRVEMDIVMDYRDYDPKTINLYVPTLHTNLWFRSLRDFLQSCVDYDTKSLAFYAGLIRSYTNKNVPLMTA